jgi:hypothetical protein
MEAIKTLDDKAEKEILDPAQWSNRYTMEKELEQIYASEEIQWQKKEGESGSYKETLTLVISTVKQMGGKRNAHFFLWKMEIKPLLETMSSGNILRATTRT